MSLSPTRRSGSSSRDVRGRHQGVAVGRVQPATLLELRAHHRRRGRQPERDEGSALGAVAADPLARGEPPRLRRDDAGDPGRLGLEEVGPGRARQLDLDVVVEVGERVVERLVERGADREDGHEDRRAEGQRRERQDEARLAAEGVADGQEGGAGEAADTLDGPVEATPPEAVGDARAAHGLADGHPHPVPDGHQGGEEGNEEPHRDLEGEHLRGREERRHVEVDEARGEDGQRVRTEGAERQGHEQRQDGVGQHHAEVEDGDLAVAGADGLHDPDLACLLGDDGVHRVHHQEAGGEEGEEAQEAEDQEDAGEEVVGGVLAGRRDEGEEDRHPRPLQPFAHGLGDAADLVAAQRRVVDQDAELVVGRAVAEVGERLEGDVPVEATDVEGGRRPDLVGEPRDPEPVDRSVDGLDLDVAGGRDVGQGEARALQEEVAAPRRPGRPCLGRDEVEALVLEVGDCRQLELAVRLRARAEADGDDPAGLRVGDPRHAADGLDQVVAERGGAEGGAGGLAGQVGVAQPLLEQRVRPGDRPHGKDADGDRQDDEDGPRARDAQVADHLAPAHARHGRPRAGPPARRCRAAHRPPPTPTPPIRPPSARRGASRRGGGHPPCGPSAGRAWRSPGRGSP